MKLTPIARCRTFASPGPGSGTGTSSRTRHSGPPWRWMRMAAARSSTTGMRVALLAVADDARFALPLALPRLRPGRAPRLALIDDRPACRGTLPLFRRLPAARDVREAEHRIAADGLTVRTRGQTEPVGVVAHREGRGAA